MATKSPSLIKYVEGLNTHNYELIFNHYEDLLGHNAYHSPIDKHSFAMVEYNGTEYIIVEERYEDTPTGAIFRVEGREDAVVKGRHFPLKRIKASLIGEISDGWYGGTRDREEEDKKEIIKVLHDWWHEAGYDEAKEIKKSNPSDFIESQYFKGEGEREESDNIKNTFYYALYRVGKQVHPELVLDVDGCKFIHSCILSVVKKLIAELQQIPAKDVTLEKIHQAIDKVVLGELVSYAKMEVSKSNAKFTTSKTWSGANLQMPEKFITGLIAEQLKDTGIEFSPEVAVAIATVYEYLAAEMIEIGGNARNNKPIEGEQFERENVITAGFAKFGILGDEELAMSFEDMNLKQEVPTLESFVPVNSEGKDWSKEDTKQWKKSQERQK